MATVRQWSHPTVFSTITTMTNANRSIQKSGSKIRWFISLKGTHKEPQPADCRTVATGRRSRRQPSCGDNLPSILAKAMIGSSIMRCRCGCRNVDEGHRIKAARRGDIRQISARAWNANTEYHVDVKAVVQEICVISVAGASIFRVANTCHWHKLFAWDRLP